MTPEEFNSAKFSINTKMKYLDQIWKVKSVDFLTGQIVISRKHEYKVAVHYSNVELIS